MQLVAVAHPHLELGGQPLEEHVRLLLVALFFGCLYVGWVSQYVCVYTIVGPVCIYIHIIGGGWMGEWVDGRARPPPPRGPTIVYGGGG